MMLASALFHTPPSAHRSLRT